MLVSTRNSDASRANTVDLDESFPQERRLRTRREFASVLSSGVKFVSDSVVVYADSSSYHQHRLGIIAAKRVGIAVRRNGIKRRIRECFRREVVSLPKAVPIDFVCIARKRKNSDLARDVSNCLHQLAHKINARQTAVRLVKNQSMVAGEINDGC